MQAHVDPKLKEQLLIALIEQYQERNLIVKSSSTKSNYKVKLPDPDNSGEWITYNVFLKNSILRRESYSTKKEKRLNKSNQYSYEILSNEQEVGRGSHGAIIRSDATYKINSDNNGNKSLIKSEKKRVIKIQVHNEANPLSLAQNESFISLKVPHLHAKPIQFINNANKNWDAKSFIVMKELSGDTLENVLKTHTLTKEQCYALTKKVVDAFRNQVLRPGIFHRDIKPSNIMVEIKQTNNGIEIGAVRFIDYGLATMNEDRKTHVIGTLTYVPAEVLKYGKTRDYKTDIYSLGLCIAEIWRALSRRELLYNNPKITCRELINKDEQPLENFGQGLDLCRKEEKLIKNLIHRMTNKNREDRPEINTVIAECAAIQNIEELLKRDLWAYIKEREDERQARGKSYNTFFGWAAGFSAELKIRAAKKIIGLLEGRQVKPLTKDEIQALKDSRLGKIIADYENVMPRKFLELSRVDNIDSMYRYGKR